MGRANNLIEGKERVWPIIFRKKKVKTRWCINHGFPEKQNQ